MRPKPRPNYENQTATIVFDLPKALYVDLKRQAELEGISVGQLMASILIKSSN